MLPSERGLMKNKIVNFENLQFLGKMSNEL